MIIFFSIVLTLLIVFLKLSLAAIHLGVFSRIEIKYQDGFAPVSLSLDNVLYRQTSYM